MVSCLRDQPGQLEEDSERLSDEDALVNLNICFLDHPQIDGVSPHGNFNSRAANPLEELSSPQVFNTIKLK